MRTTMTRKIALILAIEAIRAQIKKIAVDANAADHLGDAAYPYATRCNETRKKLLLAVEVLEAIKLES